MPAAALPKSRLVSRSVPFRFLLRIDADSGHMAASLSLSLRREPLHATEGSLSASVGVPADDRWLEVLVDASNLAEGDYSGELVLTAADTRHSWPIRFCRIPDRIAEPFPFGVYAVPLPTADPDLCRRRLREVRDAGINLICQHMDRLEDQALVSILDEAGRLGLRFMPSTNLHLTAATMSEECRDRLGMPEPEGVARGRCRGHPGVRDRAAQDLSERLQTYRTHPAFSGLVYYGDDLFLRVHYDRAQAVLSCYCDWCLEDYRRRTGQDAPIMTDRVSGTVSPDHPWLQWMRYRCRETYGGLVRRLEEARNTVAPAVRMGLCHGFPYAPFTQIGAGIYGPLTQPTSVVSSYAYPYLRSPRQDLIAHYELGRMGNRGKDVWMLGAINSNWTNYPAWQVYQNYWNMLAAGYSLIAFFSWHDLVEGARMGYEREATACQRALAACGAHKNWILPTASRWRRCPSRFALLYSFTTEAFDLAPHHRGHEHLEKVLALYRSALRQHVPLDILCEEEVLGGLLENYDAVCLHDVRVLPADVQHALEAYAARGGTVLADQDILLCYDETHPHVHVRHAVETSPETMIALLHDRHPPEVTCDNANVTIRRFQSGGIEYLVLVNNYADRYWGFRFHYWDKRVHENYEHMTHVRDEPVEADVRYSRSGHWLADLSTGAVLGVTDVPLRVRLEPSWGQVLAVLPYCRVGRYVWTSGGRMPSVKGSPRPTNSTCRRRTARPFPGPSRCVCS